MLVNAANGATLPTVAQQDIPDVESEHAPPSEMSGEEYCEALKRVESGDCTIFAEEGAATPYRNVRKMIGSMYFEVTPEELITVASQLMGEGVRVSDAVERAYALITESHLFSRNLRHWNNKVRRDFVSETVHVLVEEVSGQNDGQVPRKEILPLLLDRLGKPTNEEDASKLFNRWIKHRVRAREFRELSPSAERILGDSSKLDRAWLRLPTATKPSKSSPRRRKKDEHATAPWWTTEDVWWPEPEKASVEEEKNEYLNSNKSRFKHPYEAKRCLQRFADWILEEWKPKSKRSRPLHHKSSGQIVSPKTKGAQRNVEGKFSRKTM